MTNHEPQLQTRPTNRFAITRIVESDEYLESGDGRRFGTGTEYTYIKDTREILTNGSGMVGPADGIDRVIGTVVENEQVIVDGEPLPEPCKLVRMIGGDDD